MADWKISRCTWPGGPPVIGFLTIKDVTDDPEVDNVGVIVLNEEGGPTSLGLEEVAPGVAQIAWMGFEVTASETFALGDNVVGSGGAYTTRRLLALGLNGMTGGLYIRIPDGGLEPDQTSVEIAVHHASAKHVGTVNLDLASQYLGRGPKWADKFVCALNPGEITAGGVGTSGDAQLQAIEGHGVGGGYAGGVMAVGNPGAADSGLAASTLFLTTDLNQGSILLGWTFGGDGHGHIVPTIPLSGRWGEISWGGADLVMQANFQDSFTYWRVLSQFGSGGVELFAIDIDGLVRNPLVSVWGLDPSPPHLAGQFLGKTQEFPFGSSFKTVGGWVVDGGGPAIHWPGVDAAGVLTNDGSGGLTWSPAPGGGTGTVTSIDVDGSTTGLTFTGGPVTASGVITLGGVLGIANGGTGATTADGGLTNLLPTQAGHVGEFLTTNGTTPSWGPAPAPPPLFTASALAQALTVASLRG